MYKLLLSSRYLRTRFIALASIISVTLGVATMIVVNSVMSGFSEQMKDRIRGILADVLVETASTDGEPNPENPASLTPEQLMKLVRDTAGDYIAAMTPTVEIYGMMSFDWHGQKIHQPVTLIGILPAGKNSVSPLASSLLSRQEIKAGDGLVRPALRPQDAPLDWSLTDEDQARRREWRKWQRFRVQLKLEREALAGSDGVLPASAESTGGHTDDAAPEDAFGGPPDGLFGPDAQKSTATDNPDAPLPARVFVGIGLVSFPYINKETGKTETMMMLEPGQDVAISTIKSGNPEVVGFSATVVDLFKSGMSEYDSNLVFCNLEELQFARRMLDHEHRGDWRRGAITSLQIKLKDYRDAPLVMDRLRQTLPHQFRVRTWEQKQGPLLEAVRVESAILNVLLFLIIAVAGFGILAIFYMIVVEKTRDIGILKALGAGSRGVMSIFLSYGLSLGVVGSGMGVGLGLLFVHFINEIEDGVSWVMGHKVFDEQIYYFHEIPTAVHPLMIVWVALGAIAIAVLASVLPARRAAALHPVQALRYE